MAIRILSNAFAFADSLYFKAGYYAGWAIHDHGFLDMKAQDHHSWLYRKVDGLWEKARTPLQKMVSDKLVDAALKTDFSPRPTSNVLKRLSPYALQIAETMLPRLISSSSVLAAATITGFILMDENMRQMIFQHASQWIATFNAQTNDAVQADRDLAEMERPRYLRSDAQPSAF